MTSPINLHLSAGQSNGWGVGSFDLMPHNAVPATCKTYWNNTFPVVTPGNCQILESEIFAHDTNTCSMWLAFQMERYAICQVPSLMIPCSVGGTWMSGEDGGHHWGRNGKWFQVSVELVTDAMTQIAALDYSPTLRSIEWCQGEAEASALASGIMTKEQALDKLLDIALHYHGVYPSVPFNIYRTGSISDENGGDAGFAEIRWVQEQSALIDPYIHIVFRGAFGFPARGLINLDGIHWNQLGLNEAGKIGARTSLGMPEI